MSQVVPWSDLAALIAPYMFEGKRGRPPFPVESLLRIHFMPQWFFGMKAHIGVDADSSLVHAVRGTAGHVNDVVEANSLLHGQEAEMAKIDED